MAKRQRLPAPAATSATTPAAAPGSPDRVAGYRGRLSGPLLDRIDLHVEVPALREGDLAEAPAGEPTAPVRARVTAARAAQLARHSGSEVEHWCAPGAAAQKLLREAMSRLGLSARSFHRVLKVARTVADLAGRPGVGAAEVAEAIAYRHAEGVR